MKLISFQATGYTNGDASAWLNPRPFRTKATNLFATPWSTSEYEKMGVPEFLAVTVGEAYKGANIAQ